MRARPRPPHTGWRAVPPLVRAVTALHVALLLTWTVLYPAFLGYDEPQHLDMVVALQAGEGWPDPGERVQSLGAIVPSAPLYGGPDAAPLPRPYDPAAFAPRGERPTVEELGGNAPTTGNLPNQMSQHPPLWYATGALVLAAVPGELAYDAHLAVLRLVGVAMVAPLPLLVWLLARRLSGDGVLASTAAVLALGVPGLTRVGASAGNDALVVLAFAGALVAYGRVVTGDAGRRTAVAAGALTTLALLAKGFGLVLPPLLLAAYAVAWLRRRSWSVVGSAALALAVAGLGGLWWLRNLVRFGTVQPSGFGPAGQALRGPLRAPDSPAPLRPFLDVFSDVTASRFWAGLGVPDPPTFSAALTDRLTAVVLVGVVAALLLGVGRNGPRPRRASLLLAAAPLVLLLGLVLRADLTSYQRYDKQGVGIGVHGRYLYGGVPGLAVVVATGYRRLLGRLAPGLPLLALLGVLAVQAWALHLVFVELWARGRTTAAGVDALLAVSPWPPAVTALPAALAVQAAGVAVVLAALSVLPAGRRLVEDHR